MNTTLPPTDHALRYGESNAAFIAGYRTWLASVVSFMRDRGEPDTVIRAKLLRAGRQTIMALDPDQSHDRNNELFASIVRNVVDELVPQGGDGPR